MQYDLGAIPLCLLQLSIGLHPNVKKRQNRTYLNLYEGNIWCNLHKKYRNLKWNVMSQMLFIWISSFPLFCCCQDVNPTIIYGLRLFASFLLFWDSGKLQVSREGNGVTVGITAWAPAMDCAKPVTPALSCTVTTWPRSFVFSVTDSIQC